MHLRSSSLTAPEMNRTTGKRERQETTNMTAESKSPGKKKASVLLDAAAAIETPPKHRTKKTGTVKAVETSKTVEADRNPIKYNGVPFSGVTRVPNNFFAKGKLAREAREKEAAENARIAAIYGISVEAYLRGQKQLQAELARYGYVSKK